MVDLLFEIIDAEVCNLLDMFSDPRTLRTILKVVFKNTKKRNRSYYEPWNPELNEDKEAVEYQRILNESLSLEAPNAFNNLKHFISSTASVSNIHEQTKIIRP